MSGSQNSRGLPGNRCGNSTILTRRGTWATCRNDRVTILNNLPATAEDNAAYVSTANGGYAFAGLTVRLKMFEVVDYRRKGWGMKIDGGSIRDGMPPIHPGEGLADDLEAMEMSAEEFDQALAVPCGTIAAVLEERRSIDAELALRLSHHFGTTARLWMDLQVCYDLKVAERKGRPPNPQGSDTKARYAAKSPRRLGGMTWVGIWPR